MFKVVCGAGKHSKGGEGKVKFTVRNRLEEMKNEKLIEDFHGVIISGNFYVKV